MTIPDPHGEEEPPPPAGSPESALPYRQWHPLPSRAALREADASVTGRMPVIGPFPGYTDTAVIAGILGCENCMSYGPGSLSMAHKPDEFVPLEDIWRCEAVMIRLAEKLVLEKNGEVQTG